MDLDITPLGDRLVKVVLNGRLDTQGVDRVETRFISAIVPGANNAVVDLSQVSFVASMGIRMLVATARNLKVRQAKLALYGAQEAVSEVFEAAALHKIIAICATEADALTAVGSPQA